MHPDYSFALEKKKTWIQFAERDIHTFYMEQKDKALLYSFRLYKLILEKSDTYVMNQRFCQLVDHARMTVPDDLKFRSEWMHSRSGWMWLMEPFAVPELVKHDAYIKFKTPLRVSAIGWEMLDDDQVDRLNEVRMRDKLGRILAHGSVQFVCYFDYGTGIKSPENLISGFGMWSHFILSPGDTVATRVQQYEDHNYSSNPTDGGRYCSTDMTNILHEMRWVFTALHLMHQRLAVTVTQQACRGTRKRFERDKTPILPKYRIITLRRMEEARKIEAHKEANPVEWQWQWNVNGHWRSQWYPIEQEHREIFIEDYVKGPVGKPFKPVTKKIYRAVR
jgi:hypothetical protein